MISTFTSARATRWAGGVLVVAASALSTGIVGPIASASAAAPSLITISPASATIAQGGCAGFTVHATPAVAGQPITVQASEANAPQGASPLSTCTPAGGGSTLTALSNAVTGGSAGLPPIIPATNGTATMRFYGLTDANGFVTFGVSSTLVGSVGVVAYYNSPTGTAGADAAPAPTDTKSNTSSVSVIAGGASAVNKLTVSPASTTQYVGSGVTYTVTTTDANAVPIGGIEVDYVMSGVDTQVPVHQCGSKTASDGTATCTVTNGGTAGTDNLTFYVNATGGTPGPDSGEPQATASAVFQPLPGGGNFHIDGTCSNTRLAGPSGATCTNSTSTHAVTFTATVTNNTTTAPVSGVVVNWSYTGSGAGTSSLSANSCTTASDGSCSITLTEPSPTAATTRSLIASVGTSTSAPITANWQAPTPTSLVVNPTLQTVTNGGAAAFTASVLDQFGAGVAAHNISYLVAAGRNAGKTASGTTNASGNVTFNYTDAAPASGTTTDTVQFQDTTPGGPSGTVTATVNYISGSTQAGLIALDVSGSCNTASPTSTNSNTVGTGTIKVCALVTNASGTKLLGKPVTFAVSIGKVDSTTPQTNPRASVTVNTDGNGVATAYVSSATTGSQVVTAAADSVTANGTVTYSTSTSNLKTVKIAPATTEVSPGSSQTFTATALDAGGNPVAGSTLLFVVSGPGTIGGGVNQLQTTAANGTASVVLNTTSTDSGTGTVTVSVQNDGATQCHATGGACSAVSTYTVKTGAKQATLLLFPQKNVVAGNGAAEGVEAVALNSDGSVAPNVLVRFTVVGANNATGSATTAASGAAIFAYDAINSGTDVISAYEDLNNNQTKDAGEPSASATAKIAPAGSTPGGGKEKPTLVVSQSRANSHQEKLTLTVTSHPKLAGAPVVFYQVKKGVRHKIGPGKTGPKGKVKGTLKAAHGLTLKFQVKVGPKAGVKAGYSKVVKVHVK